MPKSLKIKLICSYLGHALLFLVFPIMIINYYYDIFSAEASTTTSVALKISCGTVMAIMIIYYFFRKLLTRFLKNLAPSAIKKILWALFKSLPVIVIGILLLLSWECLETFVMCYKYVALCIVASFVLDAFIEDWEQEWREIKLTKRQDKYRSKYNI